jgi:murein DD-endopeptidase MepM/ murein hydrolase activator NlpD
MYPVKKVNITCGFGVKGDRWLSGRHQGYDFAAPIGTDIFAIADGVVVGVGIWGSAFGKFSPVIKHGKVFPRFVIYAHVESTDVKAGDKVKKGQHIAKVGVEGNSSGPHVHVEGQKTRFWQPAGGTRLTYLFKV